MLHMSKSITNTQKTNKIKLSLTHTQTQTHTHTHEHVHTNTCRHVNNFMSNNFHSTVPSSGWTRIMFVKLQ